MLDSSDVARMHPECAKTGHDWQPWFYAKSSDRFTRGCARWNCTGRTEINTEAVVSR